MSDSRACDADQWQQRGAWRVWRCGVVQREDLTRLAGLVASTSTCATAARRWQPRTQTVSDGTGRSGLHHDLVDLHHWCPSHTDGRGDLAAELCSTSFNRLCVLARFPQRDGHELAGVPLDEQREAMKPGLLSGGHQLLPSNADGAVEVLRRHLSGDGCGSISGTG